jgi:hypothetical protein
MDHPHMFPGVHPDLIVAGFTIVLAIIQIAWAVIARTNETGMKWNAGQRPRPASWRDDWPGPRPI